MIYLLTMEVCSKHNDRVRKDIRSVCGGKHSAWIILEISGCELLHESIDFLCFAGKSETFEEVTQSGNNFFTRKVHLVDVGTHNQPFEGVRVTDHLDNIIV